MVKKTICFGIAGCGMISKFHAEALKQLSDAVIGAFCSRRIESAEKRAGEYGGKVYASIEDMAADPEIDVISICTPSGTHMETAVAAANAGKHLIIEKPIEITTERTDIIIDTCKANNVKLGAIFPRRFMETSQILKDAVLCKRFGKVVLADVYIKWYRSPEYYSNGGWKGTKNLDGGGALMNQGIHGIDLLQWVMGGIKKVSAFTGTLAHTDIEVEDTAVVSVEFNNGALGVIEGTTASWPGESMRIEISGTDGIVIMEDEIFTKWQFKNETDADKLVREKYGKKLSADSGGATDPGSINVEWHKRQFADFISAIKNNQSPAIDGAEARKAVAVITSIYKSAREQIPVIIR